MANLTDAQIAQKNAQADANNLLRTQGSQTITPTQIQPQAPINISSTFQQPTDMGTGLVASGDMIQQDIQKYLDAANQPQTETQSLYDQLLGSVSTASEGLTGRGASQTQAEQQTGFTQANKELADLNAQYLSKKAEYDKLNANIEATAGGKGLTTSMMLGQQGAVNRAAAADLGLLQAQILGKQGQVEAAQSAANRAVDLMYQDREAVYNTKLKQLELIKDKLTGEESKRAKALEYALNKEQKALEEEKANKKAITEMTLTALSSGAPQSAIDAASKATDTLTAAKILGKYSPETLKYELLKEQIKTEKAQRANYNASAAKTRKETDQIGAAVVGLDGLISTLPKSSQERYYKLQGDFDAATKNYRGAIDSANSITALSKDSTPQQQTAMIFQYMKTLDPSSTVREGEFALVGKTAGLSDRAVNALRKLDNGSRLNEAQIADIVGAAQVLSRNAKQNLDLTSAEYDRRAAKFGLPTGLFYEPQEVQQDVVDNKFSQGLGGSIQSFNTQGLSVTNSGDLDWQLPSNEPVKTNQFISGNKAKLK